MNDADLKELGEVIKEEVRGIKDIVEVTKKKVDNQEVFLHVTVENVKAVKEQQSVMNDKLDTHSASLLNIESKLESYADSYKINKHNIERVDTRLTIVEDKLSIKPPEDLKVPILFLSSKFCIARFSMMSIWDCVKRDPSQTLG